MDPEMEQHQWLERLCGEQEVPGSPVGKPKAWAQLGCAVGDPSSQLECAHGDKLGGQQGMRFAARGWGLQPEMFHGVGAGGEACMGCFLSLREAGHRR